MALDTTVGGASADSYVTLAEYEAYVVANIDLNFNGHGHDTTHELNLRRAKQWLDRKRNWVGIAQYQTQTGAWPRITDELVDGWPINVDEIPQDIKDAQCELAYQFEQNSVDPFATVSNGATKITKSKAGPVETETEYATYRETPRIVAVEGLIAPYLKAGAGQVHMGRG